MTADPTGSGLAGRERVDLRKVALFVALAILISWSMVLGFLALGGDIATMAGAGVMMAYMFGPALAVLIVQKLIYKEAVREPLGVNLRLNRWWLVAWLLPVLLVFAALAASLLVPGVVFDPGIDALLERYGEQIPPEQAERARLFAEALPVHPIWLGLLTGLVAGVTVNAVVAFGEELGWRGLMQRELRPLGYWRMSWLIGLVWGVWHLPVILLGINYPQNPTAGIFMMVAFTVLLAPIFSLVRNRAGSVVAVAVLHGTLNGVAGLPLQVLRGGTDLTVGLTGAAGLGVLVVANLVIWLRVRPGA